MDRIFVDMFISSVAYLFSSMSSAEVLAVLERCAAYVGGLLPTFRRKYLLTCLFLHWHICLAVCPLLSSSPFWNVVQLTLVVYYRRFGATYLPIFRGQAVEAELD